jgi:hypothetical protein
MPSRKDAETSRFITHHRADEQQERPKSKTNMRNSLKLALIGLLVIAPAVIHPARVRAAQAAPQAVTYTRLKGTYSFLAPSYYEYYYGQGTFTFDGNGNVTGVMNYNYDDTICTGMLLAGTYTVNPGLASGSAQISCQRLLHRRLLSFRRHGKPLLRYGAGERSSKFDDGPFAPVNGARSGTRAGAQTE